MRTALTLSNILTANTFREWWFKKFAKASWECRIHRHTKGRPTHLHPSILNLILLPSHKGLHCLLLEEEMETHSSVLAWKTPCTEKPGELQSIGSHRVRHNWSDLACMHALEKEMATHSRILAWRIPGKGACWAAVYRVTQSKTRLKRLSSSSNVVRFSDFSIEIGRLNF